MQNPALLLVTEIAGFCISIYLSTNALDARHTAERTVRFLISEGEILCPICITQLVARLTMC